MAVEVAVVSRDVRVIGLGAAEHIEELAAELQAEILVRREAIASHYAGRPKARSAPYPWRTRK